LADTGKREPRAAPHLRAIEKRPAGVRALKGTRALKGPEP